MFSLCGTRSFNDTIYTSSLSATCVLIKHGEVHVANLGDGRVVVSLGQGQGEERQLTQDHNTANPRERERVTAMGGVIKDNRVGGVLIPTRQVFIFYSIVLRMVDNFKLE